VARYTQAIMDLGATVCVRSRPLCIACPLQTHCRAHQRGLQHRLPTPKPRAARRVRSVIMLVAQRNDGSVLLQRRPERGIWGGLWCLPEFHSLDGARAFSAQYLRRAQVAHEALALVRHAFTHFELEITPLLARCEGSAGIMEGTSALWYKSDAPQRIGLPAPIQQMLDSLQETA
jgi:A/G-specific adenine glycosylase